MRRTDPKVYSADFARVVDSLVAHGFDAPIFVAVATRCTGHGVNEAIAAAQRRLAAQHGRVLLGPDTDVLDGPDHRFDGCHFTELGLSEHARLWRAVLSQQIRVAP